MEKCPFLYAWTKSVLYGRNWFNEFEKRIRQISMRYKKSRRISMRYKKKSTDLVDGIDWSDSCLQAMQFILLATKNKAYFKRVKPNLSHCYRCFRTGQRISISKRSHLGDWNSNPIWKEPSKSKKNRFDPRSQFVRFRTEPMTKRAHLNEKAVPKGAKILCQRMSKNA